MENFSTRLLNLVQSYPDKEIVHFLKTGAEDIHLSYKDLLMGARRYTDALENAGVKQGEVVILILQQSVELIYAYFGGHPERFDSLDSCLS